jgi:hypothetical protein
MKTAMQELIDELKLIEAYPMSPLVLRMANDLLEKEKQQIIQAAYEFMGTNFDSNMGRAELYYNEKYKN